MRDRSDTVKARDPGAVASVRAFTVAGGEPAARKEATGWSVVTLDPCLVLEADLRANATASGWDSQTVQKPGSLMDSWQLSLNRHWHALQLRMETARAPDGIGAGATLATFKFIFSLPNRPVTGKSYRNKSWAATTAGSRSKLPQGRKHAIPDWGNSTGGDCRHQPERPGRVGSAGNRL